MSFAPLYIANRFFFRIADFFHHWYADGSRTILQHFVAFFEQLDQTFAFGVTLRHFWKPLYGDYTIVGHIFGFFFRIARLLLGGIVYAVCAVIMLVLYATWLVIPFALLFAAYAAASGTYPFTSQ